MLFRSEGKRKIEEMHFQLIRVIDQVRMLDNDLIRLQEKVNVILMMKENERLKRGEDVNEE